MFDDDLFIQVDSRRTWTCCSSKWKFVGHFKEVLLTNYMKTFRSFLKNNEDFNSKLPRLIAIICYLLLNGGKITWTELSPNVWAQCGYFCKAIGWHDQFIVKYTWHLWKLIGKSTNSDSTEEYPRSREYCRILDKMSIGFQSTVKLISSNKYYKCKVYDRIDCFKRNQGFIVIFI